MVQTFNALKRIISEVLEVNPADVKIKAHFINDLGASPADVRVLISTITCELGVRIPAHHAKAIVDLESAFNYVFAEKTGGPEVAKTVVQDFFARRTRTRACVCAG